MLAHSGSSSRDKDGGDYVSNGSHVQLYIGEQGIWYAVIKGLSFGRTMIINQPKRSTMRFLLL